MMPRRTGAVGGRRSPKLLAKAPRHPERCANERRQRIADLHRSFSARHNRIVGRHSHAACHDFTLDLRAACTALLVLGAGAAPAQEPEVDTAELAPLVVTATRSPQALPELPGNASRVGGDEIQRVAPTHPAELLARVPGAFLNRGSGQEYLMAIRSPVLTGAGACGAFLLAENAVPVRPAGLCNINGLFELNLAQADAVEVVRGPGSVLYGANAMHGMVHVLTADPELQEANRAGVAAGGDDYARGSFDLGGRDGRAGWRLLGFAEHDGDYSDRAHYDQQKLNAGYRHGTPDGGEFRLSLSATNLNQETAGFIPGRDAFRDPALRRANFNPEAFRDATSARLVARWRPEPVGEAGPEWHFYARHSRMDFLQHFLPGNPLERNGQDSAGVLYSRDWQVSERARVSAGADLEYADIFLVEAQDAPLEDAPPALRETRPAGRHYDFTVDSVMAAAHGRVVHELTPAWHASAGLRIEYLRYDYDNNMPDGNTREDGTECGSGGCLFQRPADRTDGYRHVAPKLGLVYRAAPELSWYGSVTRGFRPPQVTELYRLQRGQAVADLDEVRLDSAETGVRGRAGALRYDLGVYAMRKSNVIFRDADGFNVSGARTRHHGLELSARYRLAKGVSLAFDGSFARHTYASSHQVAGGETIREGNSVDTAPRLLANLRLVAEGPRGLVGELESVYVDDYWLDAANEHRYGGHTLFNLRAGFDPVPGIRLAMVITNLTDRSYAERADFAFGDYRYFPGRPRSAYVQLTVSL